MDLQKLKDELANDPLGLGYRDMGDVEASERLNKPDRTPDSTTLDCSAFAAAIPMAEHAKLKAAEAAYLSLLLNRQTLPLTATAKAGLTTMLPGLVGAFFKRPGSRAEELGLGRVTPSSVAKARRS